MNYNLIVTLPIETKKPLTAAQKTEATSRLHSALAQAHEDLNVYEEVGYDAGKRRNLFEIDEAYVTIVDAGPQTIYTLMHIWDGQVGLMGVFGSLEGAQKHAFEHAHATASDDGEAAPLSLSDLIWAEYDTEPEQPKAVASEWGDQVFVIETQEVQA